MFTLNITKYVGLDTAVQCLKRLSSFNYPESDGASANLGNTDNQLALHFTEEPSDLTIANNLLSNIDLPTCTHLLLTITSNVGSFIQDDLTVILPELLESKTILVTIGIDDSSGDLEIIALEKTDDEYPDYPGGKTFVAKLKEYTIGPSGASLTEIGNYIG